MPKTIEAIYEDGVLKPIQSLNIKEHQLVKIIITSHDLEEIPDAVKKIINHLKGPLPTRTPAEMAKDTEIDVD